MRLQRAALASLLLFLCGVVAPCSATPLRDQSFTTPTNLAGVINECCRFVGQTYTAWLSGTLAGVNVDVQSFGDFPLHVAIRHATDGVPDSLTLAETIVSASTVPLSLFISFEVVVQQVAGAQYAIVVDHVGAPSPGPGQSQGVWLGAFGSFYSGGDLVTSFDGTSWSRFGTDDLHFQTFVEPVVEPTAMFLFVAGGLGLGLWARQRGRNREYHPRIATNTRRRHGGPSPALCTQPGTPRASHEAYVGPVENVIHRASR